MERKHIFFPPKVLKEVQEIAEEEGTTKAEIIRRAVVEFVRRWKRRKAREGK